MTNASKIYHNGTISTITDNKIDILIETKAACSGCHAKDACGISSEMKNKIITIQPPIGHSYKVGESVVIEGRLSDGLYSVLLAYILPTLLIILTLVIATLLKISEIYAAFYSLLIIALYFTALFLLKKRIGKRIDFKITKTN
ncbi:MAG: SoxR reducing system RseC family protein [Marinifilaceae bacterium]